MDKLNLKPTTKEALGIIVFIFPIIGMFYTMQSDIGYLKDENIAMKKSMEMYDARLGVYAGLPNEVNEVKLEVGEIYKMVNVIHDGLVAKQIIPPRRN